MYDSIIITIVQRNNKRNDDGVAMILLWDLWNSATDGEKADCSS